MMQNELEKFISSNRDDFDKQSPDPVVLNRILDQMQYKNAERSKGILIPFRTLQWVAACVILIASGIVYWTLQRQPEVVPIVKIKKNVQPLKEAGKDSLISSKPEEIARTEPVRHKNIDAINEELAKHKQLLAVKLKEHDINTKKKLVMFAGLNNMESPASRIAAATEAYQLKNADRDVVDALSETLDNDPNTNVRLAALDGLAQFYRDKYVRKKLVASLKKQQDPLVEITLINLLTRMKELGILTELEKMVKDENTMRALKDCAYSSIFRLRST
jgi:hypothetical protein